MSKIKYMVQGFKTIEEAKQFKKNKGYGVIYSGLEKSRTKKQWADSCLMVGINKNDYPVTVNWNEQIEI